MSSSTPPKTAVVLVDVYNDFIHPNGKIYPLLKESLQATDTVSHLKEVVAAARESSILIYYALHQPWKEGNYDGWQHMNATTSSISKSKSIEEGSWGAELFDGLAPDVLGNKDVVVGKHWNSR